MKAIHIQKHSDFVIFVNDKLVQKDMHDNWVAKIELTMSETKAFNNFVKALK